MYSNALSFMAGAIALGFGLCGVGFLRLWARSRDRFFLAFAGAFWLLMLPPFSVLWNGPLLWNSPEENEAWIYIARIAAYLMISGAIVVKNRNRLRRPR